MVFLLLPYAIRCINVRFNLIWKYFEQVAIFNFPLGRPFHGTWTYFWAGA
jgi:hypothetical protein